jgi:glycosyltransferase involved in cell wall biosynthesis
MANRTQGPSPAVAFDITPLQNAHRRRGIGTYVRGLASRLATQDEIPIEFWAWGGELPLKIPPPHTAVSWKRSFMPEYRGKWFFAQLAMKRRARSSRVRAVHITDPDALTPLGGRKLLTTVYDLIPLRQGIPRKRIIAWLGYRTYVRNLKRVDAYLAISKQTADELTALLRVPPGKVGIAPPGIDVPASGRPLEVARPYFLYLGGPNPNKNLGTLLAAMARATGLPEELLVAGHWLPKQVAAFDAQVEVAGLTGRVRHIGFVPDEELAPRLRQATAVVIPSLSEGFGLPVGEGLAAGALVIHSRIPVLEETSAGAALTFDPGSADELGQCLRRASADGPTTRELRGRGQRRARELTWDTAVRATLDAYRATLES